MGNTFLLKFNQEQMLGRVVFFNCDKVIMNIICLCNTFWMMACLESIELRSYFVNWNCWRRIRFIHYNFSNLPLRPTKKDCSSGETCFKLWYAPNNMWIDTINFRWGTMCSKWASKTSWFVPRRWLKPPTSKMGRCTRQKKGGIYDVIDYYNKIRITVILTFLTIITLFVTLFLSTLMVK